MATSPALPPRPLHAGSADGAARGGPRSRAHLGNRSAPPPHAPPLRSGGGMRGGHTAHGAAGPGPARRSAHRLRSLPPTPAGGTVQKRARVSDRSWRMRMDRGPSGDDRRCWRRAATAGVRVPSAAGCGRPDPGRALHGSRLHEPLGCHPAVAYGGTKAFPLRTGPALARCTTAADSTHLSKGSRPTSSPQRPKPRAFPEL